MFYKYFYSTPSPHYLVQICSKPAEHFSTRLSTQYFAPFVSDTRFHERLKIRKYFKVAISPLIILYSLFGFLVPKNTPAQL